MTKILDTTKGIRDKGSEVKQSTKNKLNQVKEKVSPQSKVSEMIKSFFKDFSKLDSKERIKRIGKILFAATIGRLLGLKKKVKKREEESAEPTQTDEEREEAAEEDEAKKQDIDPGLVGKVSKGAKPVCRKGVGIEEVAADHRHNVKMMEISPMKAKKVQEIVSRYQTHKTRYDRVGKATGLPGMLICALHYREGMEFDRYLHNGQPLGKTTTFVPKGILFKKGQWEKAAIHALGGNIKDANGRSSLKKFQEIRKSLGLTANSKDIGAMMAFSERYNGMGYRNKGIRSCYVYAGTNLLERGRYVADGKFEAKSVDRRLGTAAVIMGIQSKEASQPLRVARSSQTYQQKQAA